MIRAVAHVFLVLVLTLVSQLGGVAWLISLFFRKRLLVFAGAYVALSVSALVVAPAFGRVALSCFSDGPLQVQSPIYCALNRTYVVPELKALLEDNAQALNVRFPGTVTIVLDGSFPFGDGFPLLPHLSHDDGEKVDLAFFYRDDTGYLPGQTKSPIGYFAFEPGPTSCETLWPTLRWDMAWLQPMLPEMELDQDRLRVLLEGLTADARVGKILLEPHLKQTLNLQSNKIRFQGCRAARHDDHIHLQL